MAGFSLLLLVFAPTATLGLGIALGRYGRTNAVEEAFHQGVTAGRRQIELVHKRRKIALPLVGKLEY